MSTTFVPLSLEHVNALDRATFVLHLGSVFEHSAWIAERTWVSRPFKNVAALHVAMTRVLRAASDSEQLALLCAHPELAGREAVEDRLTADSRSEQGSAGLDRLPPAEFRRLADMNAAYRSRFGFPFIIAVRARSKDQILAEFARRLARDVAVERAAALAEVETIARIRLDRLFGVA